MRINPRYPFWYLFMRGHVLFFLEDYKSAITDFEVASERSPTALFVHWWLAAAYAQAGQQDDAEWQVEEMNSLGFKGSIATIVDSGHRHDPKYQSLFNEGVRKAGIPERINDFRYWPLTEIFRPEPLAYPLPRLAPGAGLRY